MVITTKKNRENYNDNFKLTCLTQLSIKGWLFKFNLNILLLKMNGLEALSRILKESIEHSERHCGMLSKCLYTCEALSVV